MSQKRRGAVLAVALLLVLPFLAACGGDRRYESVPSLVENFFGPEYAPRDGGNWGLDRVAVRTVDDAPGHRVLSVSFPAGSASPEVTRETGAPGGGAQFYLRLGSGPVDSARLRYYVRFPEGFQFVKGGKLPGLYGGTATAGGRVPDGTDGLSTRYMWRADGAGEVYAYLPGSQENGTSLGRGEWSWETGRWLEVEQEVTLNEPGEDDGRISVRLDGEEVYAADDLRFRDSADVHIDGLLFSTFFGGGDPSWATPADQEVQFADFAVERI